MWFQFLHSWLDSFIISSGKDCTGAEDPYPDIRHIMTPVHVAKMPTQCWVKCITDVLGTSEVTRPQDVLATQIRRVEHIRKGVHELVVVSMEYEGHLRYYTAERLVPSNPNAPLTTCGYIHHADAIDVVNSFQSIHEARRYMHNKQGIMESFDVPPTVHLNVLQFAVLCELVSTQCALEYRLLDAMCWVWARGFFVSFRQLCAKGQYGGGGCITTTPGLAIATMGRLSPATPWLVTENADVTMSPQDIKEQFRKFFKGNDTREVGEEDASVVFRDGYLVDIILAEFEETYQTALRKLNENAAAVIKLDEDARRTADAEQRMAEAKKRAVDAEQHIAALEAELPALRAERDSH